MSPMSRDDFPTFPVTTVGVQVLWTKPGATEPEKRDLRVSLHGGVFRLHGGPTGWENIPIDDHVIAEYSGPEPRPWAANFGSNVYARCDVPAVEMVRAFRELGILPPVSEE